jgi:hypothetical protein
MNFFVWHQKIQVNPYLSNHFQDLNKNDFQMKLFNVLWIALFMLALGCQNADQSKGGASAKAVNNLAEPQNIGPIFLYERYNPIEKDDPNIAKALEDKFNNLLPYIFSTDRRYAYNYVDLNDDGKMEVLVALPSEYFCKGKGGCRMAIMEQRPDRSWAVKSVMKKMSFPVYVLATSTNGWADLALYTGGQYMSLKFDGNQYPVDPTRLPARVIRTENQGKGYLDGAYNSQLLYGQEAVAAPGSGPEGTHRGFYTEDENGNPLFKDCATEETYFIAQMPEDLSPKFQKMQTSKPNNFFFLDLEGEMTDVPEEGKTASRKPSRSRMY